MKHGTETVKYPFKMKIVEAMELYFELSQEKQYSIPYVQFFNVYFCVTASLSLHNDPWGKR